MAAMSVFTILKIVGTAVSVIGQLKQAQAQKNLAKQQEMIADSQAKAQEQAAGQERASSQRAAYNAQKEGELAKSRAQAISAATGAGALDPSIVNITGGIDEETSYRAQTALFEGEERGKGLEHQAAITRATGSLNAATSRAKAQQSMFGAAGTLIEGASDLYSKYSPGGSSISSPAQTTRMRSPPRTVRYR
jgi:hypothetical protein